MRDETIEIHEGDYIVAMRLATGPGPAAAPPLHVLAGIRTRVAIAFAIGFLATTLVGIAATLL